ncbi:MAG: hypothetical protein A2W07_01635 [candidate division Zixibacteria bacterium RBG_16_43_9]|nr:MAG: hypothetical protein A2W07_01635 [candidate division Zixibacteria bacterium RBG_16_43_9]
MNKVVLAGLEKKIKIKQEDQSSVQENSLIEILKEEQECPNCHFARLKKVDGDIFCSVCGYGHKRCG